MKRGGLSAAHDKRLGAPQECRLGRIDSATASERGFENSHVKIGVFADNHTQVAAS